MNERYHILVLGGTGFIGQEVIKSLQSNYHDAAITALVRSGKSVPNGIQTIHSDLVKIEWKQLNQNPPTHIIHLARINSRRFGKFGRKFAARMGYLANMQLIKHITKYNWTCQITYVSGSLMYGDQGEKTAVENSPLSPTSFAREYFEAEKPFISFPKAQIIRLPWVFGNGSWFRGFYLDKITRLGKVPQYGDGNNLMSFIEVSDAGKLIAYAALNEAPGVINFCMETPASQAHFVKTLSEICQLPIEEISDQALKKGNEMAIYEAFTSSIALSSKLSTVYKEKATYQTMEAMLRSEIPLFLKNK